MAIDSVKRSVLEINARSSRSPGPLFDISVMHVVTAVVIRDRVWIIRRQRATPGIRNGSRVPRDLQNRPCSPKLSLSHLRARTLLFVSVPLQCSSTSRLNCRNDAPEEVERTKERGSRTRETDTRSWMICWTRWTDGAVLWREMRADDACSSRSD